MREQFDQFAERTHWLSTRAMTFVVRERDGIVVEAAPIARRFIGQSLDRLIAWLTKQGGLRREVL